MATEKQQSDFFAACEAEDELRSITRLLSEGSPADTPEEREAILMAAATYLHSLLRIARAK